MRVLFVTLNATGNLPPQLAFGERVAASGHQVRFVSHESTRGRIVDAGFEFAPLTGIPDHYVHGAPSGLDWWRDVFFAAETGIDVDRQVEEWQPDVIIVDSLLWGALPATASSGTVTAVFVHTLYGRFSTVH